MTFLANGLFTPKFDDVRSLLYVSSVRSRTASVVTGTGIFLSGTVTRILGARTVAGIFATGTVTGILAAGTVTGILGARTVAGVLATGTVAGVLVAGNNHSSRLEKFFFPELGGMPY